MRKYLLAFPYFGGKFYHVREIIPLMCKLNGYCEPFGGSASILINREPCELEVYNDLNNDIVNFFRVLRENPEELIRRIELTPYSRQEFRNCLEFYDNCSDPIERARMFYVLVRQSVNSVFSLKVLTEKSWSFIKHPKYRHSSKMSAVSSAGEWLDLIAKRLKNVTIENDDAIKVIKRYDSEDMMFYCDPPYPHECREFIDAYEYEMSDEQHIELYEVLSRCRGKIMVSSYENELYNKLYKDWIKIKLTPKTAPSSQRTIRQEVLFLNYEPSKQCNTLF